MFDSRSSPRNTTIGTTGDTHPQRVAAGDRRKVVERIVVDPRRRRKRKPSAPSRPSGGDARVEKVMLPGRTGSRWRERTSSLRRLARPSRSYGSFPTMVGRRSPKQALERGSHDLTILNAERDGASHTHYGDNSATRSTPLTASLLGERRSPSCEPQGHHRSREPAQRRRASSAVLSAAANTDQQDDVTVVAEPRRSRPCAVAAYEHDVRSPHRDIA